VPAWCPVNDRLQLTFWQILSKLPEFVLQLDQAIRAQAIIEIALNNIPLLAG
jgi:hypothetical protein